MDKKFWKVLGIVVLIATAVAAVLLFLCKGKEDGEFDDFEDGFEDFSEESMEEAMNAGEMVREYVPIPTEPVEAQE